MDNLTAEDLTPRERIAFIASCQLKDGQLLCDPDFEPECKRLAELGWLERVDHERGTGYVLSLSAATAHNLGALIEEAEGGRN